MASPDRSKAWLFGVFFLLSICMAFMISATVVPAWSRWRTTHVTYNLTTTVYVGLWQFCTDVATHDDLTQCRNIDKNNWPLWGNSHCAAYFDGTRSVAIIASTFFFLALCLAAAALFCVSKPRYRKSAKTILLVLLCCTFLGFVTSLLAFSFWIVVAENPCLPGGVNGTNPAWLFKNPPERLHGYGTCFILTVFACGLALLSCCAILYAFMMVKKHPPTPPEEPVQNKAAPSEVSDHLSSATTKETVVPYVVPYQPPLLATGNPSMFPQQVPVMVPAFHPVTYAVQQPQPQQWHYNMGVPYAKAVVASPQAPSVYIGSTYGKLESPLSPTQPMPFTSPVQTPRLFTGLQQF